MSLQLSASRYGTVEWSYTSGRTYDDPFNQVELDVILTHEGGSRWRVPAFWAGGETWRVRFSPPEPGTYQIRTEAGGSNDPALHDQRGTLSVAADATERLQQRRLKPLRVSDDRRTFEHVDGTSFFWLGDTWWMGLAGRLHWPEEVQRLGRDRREKGFTVIQIVAGLYPDMPAFDPRGANEAGFPWAPDYARINPAYFDMADLRIQWLIDVGFVPCIVGAWGYHLQLLGPERMKQHWRYLIARWGAYPVVWCLAGEATMPYYLSETPERDRAAQKEGWTEVGRYVQATDPYHHPVTIHPNQIGRDQVTDDSVLDFDMLQTGHGGHDSVANTVEKVRAERGREPTMPVVVGEVSYEGILHGTQAEIQRLTFWAAMLSGAGGFTYGANGIWQLNRRDRPYGPSPHGASWGDTPWEEAYQLPGSRQLGLAKALLGRYRWWEFTPHQAWVQPAATSENVDVPFAAGIPGEVRIIYFYQPSLPWRDGTMKVCEIESGVDYRAFFWNPRDGTEHDLGSVTPEADGSWEIPLQPTMKDWVVVLEAKA